MSFLQTISFHTDRIESFVELDRRWTESTEGRRTLVDSALYRDRTDPTHYVAVNYFSSWEEAQVNSALPETDAFATEAMGLATGPVDFTDLDLVTSVDVRRDAAEGMRSMLEANVVPDGLFDDDLLVDMFVPNWHQVVQGLDQMMAGMRQEAASRTVEQWDVHPSGDGFVAEYTYLNHATAEQPQTRSVGVVVAHLRGGRIATLKVHCAGNWTAELEREMAQAQNATVSA